VLARVIVIFYDRRSSLVGRSNSLSGSQIVWANANITFDLREDNPHEEGKIFGSFAIDRIE